MNKTAENILQSIYSPKDLKKVNIDDLPKLCEEIREYMLNILAHIYQNVTIFNEKIKNNSEQM